jgi:RNA polymerase sigma-19 factor, ECF subfamily
MIIVIIRHPRLRPLFDPRVTMHSEQVQAVRTLYVDHLGWLRSLLRQKLGCHHKAEDLAHDAFVKVMASQAAQAIKEPRAFLTTVAHGLVVSHWRRLDLERAYVEALEVQAPGLSPSPEERALVLEALMQIDSLLGGMPHKASRAFLMAQLDGMSYQEIADELGVSDRMVKKYMVQVMQQLLLHG